MARETATNLLFIDPPGWRDPSQQRHGETAGRLFARLGFKGMDGLLHKASKSDLNTIQGMIVGYSEGLAVRFFPTPKTDVLSRSALAVVIAQGDFANGVQEVLREAIASVKEARPYQKLDISRFVRSS